MAPAPPQLGRINQIGIVVRDLDRAASSLEQLGYLTLQRASGFGRSGDGGYVYLDTVAACGTVTEFIQIATEPKEPDFVYPPGR